MKKHYDLNFNLCPPPYPVLQLQYPDATDLIITTIKQPRHKQNINEREGGIEGVPAYEFVYIYRLKALAMKNSYASTLIYVKTIWHVGADMTHNLANKTTETPSFSKD